MKISTRLKFSALVPLLMALVIGLALFFSNRIMERAQAEADSARRIVRSMYELNSFARHFMTYHEERAKLQFLAEHDSITGLISGIRLSGADKRRIVDSIRHNNESMREAFLKLVFNYERNDSARNRPLLREAEERLAGRILVKAGDALSDAVYLDGLIHNEITSTQRTMGAFVFLLIICATLPLTIVLIRMLKNTTASLAMLRTGTEVIASGDLDHRIGIAARDEIGDLSRAFDLMTEQLKDTTVSRDELSREVEERKRAEEELRRSWEWFRVTLSSIGDAVIAADASGLVTFSNPVAAELTGLQSENALGQPIQTVFRIINQKTRQPAENIVDRVLREGRVINLANHTALVTPDGREIPIEDSAAPIEDSAGNIIGVVLVFHDVTEKRRAQEALRASEAQLRTIVENLTQGVVVSNMDAKFLFWNRASLDMHGYSSTEECLRKLPELADTFRLSEMNGTVVPVEEWPLSRILHGEKLNNLELRVQRIDFDWQRIYSYGGSIAYDELGKPLLAVVTVNDITERKQMEEELRKSHDELELRVRERTAELTRSIDRLELLNQELEEFAFVASHDLQEPLRKVQTFCDIAQKRCASVIDDTSREYLDRVMNSTDRMRQLLRDLLEFSRVASRPERFKILDLQQIVREATDVFEATIADSGGVVEAGEMLLIEADASQMRQLFQNLIGNSLKYRSDQSPRISVHAGQEAEGTCEICVKDNGIGFDQQYADLIFKPFQRLHGRGQYDGTGMGLAISRKIVERHGGSIKAESEPGRGSTFIIRLPVRQISLENVSDRRK